MIFATTVAKYQNMEKSPKHQRRLKLESNIPEYCMSGYIDSSGMEERTAIDCSRSFWMTANKKEKASIHCICFLVGQSSH